MRYMSWSEGKRLFYSYTHALLTRAVCLGAPSTRRGARRGGGSSRAALGRGLALERAELDKQVQLMLSAQQCGSAPQPGLHSAECGCVG